MDYISELNAAPADAGKKVSPPALDQGLYTLRVTKMVEEKYIDGAKNEEEMVQKHAIDGVLPGVRIRCTLEVAEGEHAGHRIYKDFIVAPSANQRLFRKDDTLGALAQRERNELAALRLRVGWKEGDGPIPSWDWFEGKAFFAVVTRHQSPGKDARNYINFIVGRDEVIELPKLAEVTTKPVEAKEEPPF